MTAPVTQLDIDQRVRDLYNEYCHGGIDRREFLLRAGAVVGGVAMAQALLPRYARAQTISFTDTRIKPQPLHRGRGSTRRGRGLRGPRADGLFPVGGYPGNDDDGRALQARLDQGTLRTDMVNSATFLKTHRLSTGRLGVTGFCWGGSTVNFLAVALGGDLQAGVPFYGAAAGTAGVPKIKAPLLLHYAETDPRINEMWPAFEAALRAAGRPYQAYVYPGTQHGFHNDSTPRYLEASAKLAWDRATAFFRTNLA